MPDARRWNASTARSGGIGTRSCSRPRWNRSAQGGPRLERSFDPGAVRRFVDEAYGCEHRRGACCGPCPARRNRRPGRVLCQPSCNRRRDLLASKGSASGPASGRGTWLQRRCCVLGLRSALTTPPDRVRSATSVNPSRIGTSPPSGYPARQSITCKPTSTTEVRQDRTLPRHGMRKGAHRPYRGMVAYASRISEPSSRCRGSPAPVTCPGLRMTSDERRCPTRPATRFMPRRAQSAVGDQWCRCRTAQWTKVVGGCPVTVWTSSVRPSARPSRAKV